MAMQKRYLSMWALGAALAAMGCGGSPTEPTAPTGPPAATLTELRVSGGGGLEVGGTAQMRADGLFSDGSVRIVTSQVTWTSLSLDLATIASTGIVSGVAVGTVTIQAAYEGKTTTHAVQVRGRRVNVIVTAIALECAADCEDFTQGDGDFAFYSAARGTVGDGQTATTNVLSQTSGYPSAGSVIRLATGQLRALQSAATFQIREEAGAYLEVAFRATEWDEILGSSIADRRMNDDSNTARFVWSARPGEGWQAAPGTHTMSVGGSGCLLRLRYGIAVQPAS
jgi:hypothetical protein